MVKKTGIFIGLLWGLMQGAHVLALPPNLNNVGKQGEAQAATANDNSYRIGDRLAQPKAQNNASSASGAFKEITWEALVPKDWDPMKAFKGLDLNKLSDADPRAMDALQKMREAWDNAPVERSLNGARVRIPGFIVPLDTQRGQLKEFLLVPYFGGCIHTPPPPANQIISVQSDKALKMQTMDAVWVSGVLETTRSDTSMGSAGYRMKAVTFIPYEPPQK